MYGDVVLVMEHAVFCGSIHTHCVTIRRWMQHAAQIKLDSAYIVMRPHACIKVGHRMQCERGLTLQTE